MFNQPVDLNQPVSVSLPLGAWNTVQTMLSKRPWDEVNALIQAIQQQLEAASSSSSLSSPRSSNVVPWENREPAQ